MSSQAMSTGKHVVLERAAILAVATVVCAVLTMITGVGVLHATLPPGDTARGGPWFTIEVMTVAGPLCVVCALIVYPLMLWGLARTNLARSLPVVFVTALASMAASARLGPLGAGISLVCSAIAIGVCRRVFRERTPSDESSSSEAPRSRQRGAIVPLGFGAAAGMLLFPIACAAVAAATDGLRAVPASAILFFGVPIGACIGVVAGWCLAVALAEDDGR